jgi:deferrochelatase/peroxidase EfeB
MAQSDLTPAPRVVFDDVQGLVRFGHGHLTEAAFLLLRIEDAAAARAWLAAAPVMSARDANPLPDTALQVAFTSGGLRRLGLAEDAIAGFSDEFLSGMAVEDNRSRRLGDIGDNSPSRWAWGGAGQEPDVLVMLYARAGGIAAWTEAAKGATWTTAFSAIATLPTKRLGDTGDAFSREPFGFADGISQPELDWRQERRTGVTELTYGNSVALGEFLLGYRNEYGNFTDRPLLDPVTDPHKLLPRAADDPTKCDLGRNGTYLVLRDLQQDVRSFWQYLERQANGTGATRRLLAEAMVGRTMAGDPLVAQAERHIEGVAPDERLNHFTFQADPYGTACPLGAHIRRANPRNADLPDGTAGLLSQLARTFGYGTRHARDDLISSTRFHRLLRRGRAYGTLVPDDEALQPGPSGEDIGLRFVCLNANIVRQFEFVQTAWIAGTKFGGLTQESDPLLGNRQPAAGCPVTDSFSLPQPSGASLRLREVPQFVTVRGGAYFFLPSLSALRYLANLDN